MCVTLFVYLCLCFHMLIFEGSGGRSSVGTLVGACQLRNSFGLFLHARHHLFCADLHISLNFGFVFVFFVILYLCLEAAEFIWTPLGRMLSSGSKNQSATKISDRFESHKPPLLRINEEDFELLFPQK